MPFALRCVASRPGFYGDREHFPVGSVQNPNRAGVPFTLLADGLRYDSEGKMWVTKDMKPVLPSWVIPQEPVLAIDPKLTPYIVVEPHYKKLDKKRKLAAGVKEAAPMAWPQNMKRRDAMQGDRVVKIKRAGTGMIPGEDQGTDDESEG